MCAGRYKFFQAGLPDGIPGLLVCTGAHKGDQFCPRILLWLRHIYLCNCVASLLTPLQKGLLAALWAAFPDHGFHIHLCVVVNGQWSRCFLDSDGLKITYYLRHSVSKWVFAPNCSVGPIRCWGLNESKQESATLWTFGLRSTIRVKNFLGRGGIRNRVLSSESARRTTTPKLRGLKVVLFL